jgi:S1-C subfamily serine protease
MRTILAMLLFVSASPVFAQNCPNGQCQIPPSFNPNVRVIPTDQAVSPRVKIKKLYAGETPFGMAVMSTIGQGTVIKVEGNVAWILTASHVVSGSIEIIVEYKNGTKSVQCKLVADNKGSDVAIVRAWCPEGLVPHGVAETDVKEGDTVTWCSQTGYCQNVKVRGADEKVGFLSNITVVQGDSGSPVFNDNGQIVGVVTGGMAWVQDRAEEQKTLGGKATWPARASNVTMIRNMMNQAFKNPKKG